MQRLLLLGLNHATAPLAVRERVAFSHDDRRSALVALKEKWPEAEAVLVCTCNRMELYVARPVHGRPRVQVDSRATRDAFPPPAGSRALASTRAEAQHIAWLLPPLCNASAAIRSSTRRASHTSARAAPSTRAPRSITAPVR